MVTQQRAEKLKEALDGRYITIWECEFDRAVKENGQLKNFIKELDIPTPLAIRDALCGKLLTASFLLVKVLCIYFYDHLCCHQFV
jgi:hypothetical protein